MDCKSKERFCLGTFVMSRGGEGQTGEYCYQSSCITFEQYNVYQIMIRMRNLFQSICIYLFLNIRLGNQSWQRRKDFLRETPAMVSCLRVVIIIK